MAWNHLIQRNNLQACVPKGSQEVGPHASTGGVRKGGGSLAVSAVGGLLGYLSKAPSCPEKKHVKKGPPHQNRGGEKAKIENSKI